MTRVSSQFWILKHTESGSVVAKFDTAGGAEVPDEIATYDSFEIQTINSRSELPNTVDHSGLSDYEKTILSQVYPIQE